MDYLIESLAYYEEQLSNVQKKIEANNKINVFEMASKIVNDYFDILFVISDLESALNTRLERYFNTLKRLCKTDNYNSLSDNEKENYYNTLCDTIENIVCTLSNNRIKYGHYDNYSIIDSKCFQKDSNLYKIFNIISNQNATVNKYSLLDLIYGYDSSYLYLSQLYHSDNNIFNNFNVYSYRSKLNEYNNIKQYCYRFIAGEKDYCKISNNAFDITFCIPKYSDHIGSIKNLIKDEKVSIANAIKYTKTDGLIIFVLNKYRLTKDISSLLAKYIYNTMVFPLANFESNNNSSNSYQKYYDENIVIIVGNKRKDKIPDQELYTKIRALYKNNNDIVFDVLPDKFYIGNTHFEIDTFRGSLFSDSMLSDVSSNSSAYTQLFRDMNKDKNIIEKRNPLLPFSVGQLGLVLTSGCLNGIIEEPSDDSNKKYYHVIKGSVIKTTDCVYADETKSKITEETVSNKVNINIISPNGECYNLA